MAYYTAADLRELSGEVISHAARSNLGPAGNFMAADYDS